jgi:hypothetical protein
MAGKQLLGTLGTTRVFVFRLAKELRKLLIAFLLGVGNIQVHGFSALKQVVSGAD